VVAAVPNPKFVLAVAAVAVSSLKLLAGLSAASAVAPCAAVAYAVDAVVAAVPNPNVVRVVAASTPVRSDLPYANVVNAAIAVKSASTGCEAAIAAA
jgi:hypothetical protein